MKYIVECSKCNEQLQKELPDNLPRDEIITLLEENTEWDVLPTLCPKCKGK